MSIEERIAELLSEHRFERWSVSKDGYFAWWGHCVQCGFEPDRRNSSYVGWELDMHDDEARHAASVLVAELGLQPRWSWESAEECRPDGFGSPEEALAEGHDKPTHCRYVTPWELS